MILLLIDVFFLFVSVLNQLHPILIYIVYISVLLVVFPEADLEGGVRAPLLKFAKHTLYNVN